MLCMITNEKWGHGFARLSLQDLVSLGHLPPADLQLPLVKQKGSCTAVDADHPERDLLTRCLGFPSPT